MPCRCCFPMPAEHRPTRGIIAPEAPPSRRGNAPFAVLLSAVRATGFPARLSRDAGGYLCNYAYWRALGRVHGKRPLVQFVHIPLVRLAPRRARQTPHAIVVRARRRRRGASDRAHCRKPPLTVAAKTLFCAAAKQRIGTSFDAYPSFDEVALMTMNRRRLFAALAVSAGAATPALAREPARAQ